MSYTIRVSYLEIYNNNGYDLLDPEHETKNLEDLPRVRACFANFGLRQRLPPSLSHELHLLMSSFRTLPLM
jgi:hypothetical protein